MSKWVEVPVIIYVTYAVQIEDEADVGVALRRVCERHVSENAGFRMSDVVVHDMLTEEQVKANFDVVLNEMD